MRNLITAVLIAGLLSFPVLAVEPSITEISDDDIVVRYSDRVFRPVSRNINVPDNLSGQYVVAVAVVTSVQLNDAQEDQLETAIEGIAGVSLAKILVGSSRLSHDRLPADIPDPDSAPGGQVGTDYQLRVRLEMGYNVEQAPLDTP